MPPPAPTRPPLSQPLDLVLHIGSGKTGTSSIQFFLHQNRERLAELGCLYPQSPGRRRHARVSLFVQPESALDNRHSWGRQRTDSPRDFRKAFRRKLFKEINESGLSRVLLSDEALFGSPDAALERLRRFTDRVCRSLRLVAYLRRQDDHLVSRYQQAVKTGETKRLVERTRQLTLSRTYDYYARIRLWQRLLDPAEFVVRRFERESFVDGSLYQDFLDAAGVDARVDALEPVRSMNESLDAEAVEFLRILNIFRKEYPEMAASLPTYNRPFFGRLAAASTGPTLTMPGPVLDEFMAQWEESNRRVAVEILGDEDGQLFRAPRKTRNTTTEQHLDPTRIGHFRTVLDLPEQMQAALLDVAEREAKAR
jgi:hypothetical protein